MAITQAMCTSFKVELLKGLHDFTTGADVFKLALFRATASISGTFGAATTNYSDMGVDQASGTNYVAGGSALTNVTPTSSSTTALTDFADLVFTNVTITTSGCLIYNTTGALNQAIAVFSFGGDKTATAGDMTMIFPTADASNAIIRLV
tara:strand:- start:866 stop:1312 length:447 start_codon:yes stop_codon:yes gene_type:complete